MVERGYLLIEEGNQLHYEVWLEDLFSLKWYFLVVLTFLPWFIWLFIYNRQKVHTYVVSGIIAMFIASVLDAIGLSYGLWRYHVKLIPMVTGTFPWNITLIPVCFMIGYQIADKRNVHLVGIIIAFGFAFIGEPLMDSLKVVSHNNWKHYLSFPIYYMIFVLSYKIGKRLTKPMDLNVKETVNNESKYNILFKHSSDAVYYIEKLNDESEFHFSDANEAFFEQLGYSREELKNVNPKSISDQTNYNVNIKYRHLFELGEMQTDTTFITKDGKKKFVSVYCKVFQYPERVEVLSIVRFLPNEVSTDQVN